MTTGLDVFDTTVQETNLWLKDVMERIGTYDRHSAYSTLRAVLHAVRDRIGPENAAHLGAQLPMLIRGLYYEGWDPTGKPTKERHEAQFLAHIAKELPRAEVGEVERGTRAVLDVLSKRIDRGAAVKIAIIFPEELLKFWPAFIQEAVRGRQQGATSSRLNCQKGGPRLGRVHRLERGLRTRPDHPHRTGKGSNDRPSPLEESAR